MNRYKGLKELDLISKEELAASCKISKPVLMSTREIKVCKRKGSKCKCATSQNYIIATVAWCPLCNSWRKIKYVRYNSLEELLQDFPDAQDKNIRFKKMA